MKNQNITIKKMMSFINNPIEQGGFWLPNIQRHFVWNGEQIIKLFDSIMREYPIGTLMIWKTNQKIKYRRFTSNFKSGMSILGNYENTNDKQKLLVLDGQQRLQSLYIAIKGDYNGKELFIDILDKCENEEDVKYKFKFLNPNEVKANMINVKRLIDTNKKPMKLGREILQEIKLAKINVDDEDEHRIMDTVDQFNHIFCTQEILSYQELDSVDNTEIYNENDIVEIFIRANSGGTILEKSDLLFALLTTSIEDIEEKLETLVEELNRTGYKFTRDFVLKVCLTLIGAGSKYDVDKFRKKENLEKIDENWDEITDAIMDVKDFIYGSTYLRCDKTLGAYSPLIPIIYLRYKYADKYKEAIKEGLENWLVRVIFTGVYSGSADSLIDLSVKNIDEKGKLDFESLENIFKNKNKSLEITEQNILSAGYQTEASKRKLYLLFNMWYNKFNFTPCFKENFPNIDHIFPQSELKKIKIKGEKRKVQKYKGWDINQIGNCMLLSVSENQMGGKGDKLPIEWFKDKDDSYFDMHLIPKDRSLLEIDNYEKFIEERNKLIVNKIKGLFYL